MQTASVSRRVGPARAWIVAAILTLQSILALASPPPLPAGEGPDWPQFRGPRRDGTSDETGLLRSWPEGGPALLWTAAELGRGYAAPIVVGDAIVITGDVGDDLVIFALGLDGHVRWRAKNGASWKNPWPGARSSCTHDEGKLYHMNAHGRIASLDATTGEKLWATNVLERFGAKNGIWGMSESLLVDGKKVVVTVCGEKGLMAALNKASGETVWTSPPLEGEKMAYASTMLVPAGKRRLLLNAGDHHAFAVDADTGEHVWAHPHPVPENVLGTAPAFVDGSVYIANSSRDHSALYRLRLGSGDDGDARVDQVWSVLVKNGQGGLIHVAGRLFGGNGADEEDGLSAVDPETGAIAKVEGGLGFGAAAFADGRIYYLSQKGEAALLAPTDPGSAGGASAGAARIVGRFRLARPRQNDAWTHPVICRGRLYLRYHDELRAYDVRRRDVE